MTKPYTGYNALDLQSEYAPFYRENMNPLADDIERIAAAPPSDWETFPGFDRVAALQDPGYTATENG